jgi:hypothetical protein
MKELKKKYFLNPQAWYLYPLPEVFYEGRAAEFEPELLPRYQWAIPAPGKNYLSIFFHVLKIIVTKW